MVRGTHYYDNRKCNLHPNIKQDNAIASIVVKPFVFFGISAAGAATAGAAATAKPAAGVVVKAAAAAVVVAVIIIAASAVEISVGVAIAVAVAVAVAVVGGVTKTQDAIANTWYSILGVCYIFHVKHVSSEFYQFQAVVRLTPIYHTSVLIGQH